MSVRTLTLEEWFSYYQLKHIQKSHFHIPALLDLNVERLYEAYAGRKFPLSFLVVKAVGLTLKHHPEINRQFVYLPWGSARMRESKNCAVNFPVLLNAGTKKYLSAMIIQKADEKSVSDIKAEVKQFLQKTPQEMPIGKYIAGKSNSFFNRSRLKAIHWLVNHLPFLQDKFGAGTVSVSSLLNVASPGTHVSMIGRGPGAFSITLSHFDERNKRVSLALAWDHYALSGVAAASAAASLAKILQGELAFEEMIPKETSP